jgi:hypothetical protein
MTYADLKTLNTGFNTSHVIDDVISNARFCFGKKAMDMTVSEYDLRKIGDASVYYVEQIHIPSSLRGI